MVDEEGEEALEAAAAPFEEGGVVARRQMMPRDCWLVRLREKRESEERTYWRRLWEGDSARAGKDTV